MNMLKGQIFTLPLIKSSVLVNYMLVILGCISQFSVISLC